VFVPYRAKKALEKKNEEEARKTTVVEAAKEDTPQGTTIAIKLKFVWYNP